MISREYIYKKAIENLKTKRELNNDIETDYLLSIKDSISTKNIILKKLILKNRKNGNFLGFRCVNKDLNFVGIGVNYYFGDFQNYGLNIDKSLIYYENNICEKIENYNKSTLVSKMYNPELKLKYVKFNVNPIFEKDKATLITIDIPGIEMKNIKVKTTNGIIKKSDSIQNQYEIMPKQCCFLLLIIEEKILGQEKSIAMFEFEMKH